VLVGYDENFKAYRLWDPEKRKVIVSNDLTNSNTCQAILLQMTRLLICLSTSMMITIHQ
jgi:hypothetical protein